MIEKEISESPHSNLDKNETDTMPVATCFNV